MTALPPAPASDVDLFADEVLADPYPVYRELRDLGPAVWLERCRAFAIGRYADVRAVLRDHATFASGDGIALNDEKNEQIRGAIIASDPPLHDVLRSVAWEDLTPPALQGLRADFERRAEVLVDELVERQEIDVIADLATAFPLAAVFDLIGFPEEGRDAVPRIVDHTFNSYGPPNERTRVGLVERLPIYDYLDRYATRERLRPDGLGAHVLDAVDAGVITERQGRSLLVAYATAGLDTTVHAIGSGVYLFARFADQWDLVRRGGPEAVPAAFNEILRYESPVLVFARHATADWSRAEVTVPAGSWVAVLYASANRDERHWPDPDRFDVTRRAAGHLAFGHGIHVCVGQELARIEGAAVFRALATRVRRFEIGEPVRKVNNILRGFDALPCRLVV